MRNQNHVVFNLSTQDQERLEFLQSLIHSNTIFFFFFFFSKRSQTPWLQDRARGSINTHCLIAVIDQGSTAASSPSFITRHGHCRQTSCRILSESSLNLPLVVVIISNSRKRILRRFLTENTSPKQAEIPFKAARVHYRRFSNFNRRTNVVHFLQTRGPI
ncbi:hypothetical protein PIB30_030165 [Stylosanthes scabra]|uniref:Uncharacterized protein n=1 Tax=Stylosanthes scabra TaxID=79078 RepID=A0ABU6RBU9_9FABA|nr:hypothetical protein [Stylosanthes scabra]